MRLRAAGCIAAEEEAALLRAACGSSDEALERAVLRREAGEPLAWITGSVEFCGRPLHVSPGVYVPRPSSEDLAVRAAALLPRGGTAADLCTGTGAVAAHLVATGRGRRVVGVDLDPRAVANARRNGVPAMVGDVDGPLRDGAFDLVTAVVPYVPTAVLPALTSDAGWEPRAALDGGRDGLDVVRRAIIGAARLLRPGGWFVTELGGEQDDLVAGPLDAAGFEPAEPWFDDDGDLRGISAARRTTTW